MTPMENQHEARQPSAAGHHDPDPAERLRTRRRPLSVTGGDPVTYLCEQGQRVQVRYFALSDQSLNFVKLALPDGKDYTLPQSVSASGARYTDDHEAVWWNKGDEGFVEMRDKDGEWQSVYNDCKQQ